MKAPVLLAATAALWMATSGVRADDAKADAKFCAHAVSFQANVAAYNAMGPDSTVAQVRTVLDRIDNDLKEMDKAASKMKSPTAKEFRDALKTLETDRKNVPDDATVEQVHQKLQKDIEHARTTGRQLASEAGCPTNPNPNP